jgi:hypothetical protein
MQQQEDYRNQVQDIQRQDEGNITCLECGSPNPQVSLGTLQLIPLPNYETRISILSKKH